MVELAALTYSPISFKRSRRTLLGTPTSLARALTRIFDTSLLYSARIELRGVTALGLMRSTLDELFIGDATAVRRISSYLTRLASVIDELTAQGLLERANQRG